MPFPSSLCVYEIWLTIHYVTLFLVSWRIVCCPKKKHCIYCSYSHVSSHYGEFLLQREAAFLLLSISPEAAPPGQLRFLQQSTCQVHRYLSAVSQIRLLHYVVLLNWNIFYHFKCSYKVREIPQQSTSHHRKRSTQSDTALLPSNVYFQRTLSPVSVPSKTSSRTGRHKGSKVRHLIFPHTW